MSNNGMVEFLYKSPLATDRPSLHTAITGAMVLLRQSAAGGLQRLRQCHAELPAVPLPLNLQNILNRKDGTL